MNIFLFIFFTSFEVKVYDTPYDGGGSITLEWKLPPFLSPDKVDSFVIFRGNSSDGPFEKLETVPRGVWIKRDNTVKNNIPYFYFINIWTEDTVLKSPVSSEVRASIQFFHLRRLNIFIGVLFFAFCILLYVNLAKRGKHITLRKIPGLEAVEEAVGRATEMGRPVLYVPGLSTISDVATIASLNILSQVAKKAGEYETAIMVPNRDAVVYTVAREMVKEAYTSIGRPDLFDSGSVFYLTDSQFGYAAAVCGMMVREKPATNFLLGMFWAESLLLAETGASTGAIQIAGTDAITQLPFFITACDYTLIGEELYAASAYLSREPVLVSTIRAQDIMKILIGIVILGGSILGLLGKIGAIQFLFW